MVNRNKRSPVRCGSAWVLHIRFLPSAHSFVPLVPLVPLGQPASSGDRPGHPC